jgi:hypothetical protein
MPQLAAQDILESAMTPQLPGHFCNASPLPRTLQQPCLPSEHILTGCRLCPILPVRDTIIG